MNRLTEEEKAYLKNKLEDMRALSDGFYTGAVAIGVHPFLEFTGLMNEYINMCAQALADEIDFTQCSVHSGNKLPMAGHHRRYIQEKMSCILSRGILIED